VVRSLHQLSLKRLKLALDGATHRLKLRKSCCQQLMRASAML
jgi:hypothetical protein